MPRFHIVTDAVTGQVVSLPFTIQEEIDANAVPDYSGIDAATLNRVLIEPGSVVRALGLVMLAEINKLRIAGGLVAYTLPQFLAALRAQMR